jgi:circadian clock protein KaiC
MTEIVPPQTLARLPTGIAGLDTILGGGVLEGGLYLVMGHPGTGKTVLANQVSFGHVRRQPAARAVYLTLLAESHGRMLAHLGSFDFFEPRVVGESLLYVGGYRTLEDKGLDGLLDLIRVTTREQHASLLVLDGLVSAVALAASPLAFKRFIHQLSVFAHAGRCTTWLLTSVEQEQPEPEHTMVDGIIELSLRQVGMRAVREVVVRKLRGGKFLEGRHAFDIGNEGIVVYPRTEALVAAIKAAPSDTEALEPVGVPGLDRMLGGGVLAGTSTLVLGGPGTGKTSLALQFVSATGAGERGVFMGLYESPPRLQTKADLLGLALAGRVRAGEIEIVWRLPVEQPLDALAAACLAAVDRLGARRLAVDGLSGLHQAAIYPERFTPFVSALIHALRARSVTTLLTLEGPALLDEQGAVPAPAISGIVENIVLLRAVERGRALRRTLSLLKVRERGHDATTREFTIGSRGVALRRPGTRRA